MSVAEQTQYQKVFFELIIETVLPSYTLIQRVIDSGHRSNLKGQEFLTVLVH